MTIDRAKQLALGLLAGLLFGLALQPALAQTPTKGAGHQSDGLLLFSHPVTISGIVTRNKMGQIRLTTSNGDSIVVPNMALVWKNNRQIRFQNASVGSHVILTFREDEPYRVMYRKDGTAIVGTYDGVFRLPEGYLVALGASPVQQLSVARR